MVGNSELETTGSEQEKLIVLGILCIQQAIA